MKPSDITEGRTYRTAQGFRYQVVAIFSDRQGREVSYLILPGGDAPHVGETLRCSMEEFCSRVVAVEAEKVCSMKGGL